MTDGTHTLPITVEHVRLARVGVAHPELTEARADLAALMIVPEDDDNPLREQWNNAAMALEVQSHLAAAPPGKIPPVSTSELVRFADGMKASGALSSFAWMRYAAGEQAARTLRYWLDRRLSGEEQSARLLTEAKQRYARSVPMGARKRKDMQRGLHNGTEALATIDKRWGAFRSVSHLYAAHLDLAQSETRGAEALPCAPWVFVEFLWRAESLRRAALFHGLTLAETMWKLREDVVDELHGPRELDSRNPTGRILAPIQHSAVK